MKYIEKAFSSHQLGHVNGQDLIDNYCPKINSNNIRHNNTGDDEDDEIDNGSVYNPSKINAQ